MKFDDKSKYANVMERKIVLRKIEWINWNSCLKYLILFSLDCVNKLQNIDRLHSILE